MSDNANQSGIWIMRIGFCGLVALILFFQLLPLVTQPRAWTGPDLVMAFAFAWAVRRPDYLPPAMLAGLFLLCDLLLQRPPGLWAALMLLACESLKTQVRTLRDSGVVSEILSVSLMIIGVSLAYRLILTVLLIDVPPLSLSAVQTGATLLAYPFTVLMSQTILGVRRTAPGDLDRMQVRS